MFGGAQEHATVIEIAQLLVPGKETSAEPFC